MVQVENGFTVFDAIGQDPKGEGLHPGDRIGRRGALGHHAREHRDLGDPPAIFLAFEFDMQLHWFTLPPTNHGPPPGQLSHPTPQRARAPRICSGDDSSADEHARSNHRGELVSGHLFARQAEAALAMRVLLERGVERGLIELGPEHGREV